MEISFGQIGQKAQNMRYVVLGLWLIVIIPGKK